MSDFLASTLLAYLPESNTAPRLAFNRGPRELAWTSFDTLKGGDLGKEMVGLMVRRLEVFLLWLFFASIGIASAQGWNERDYQRTLCAGMELEVRVEPQSRVDCLSDTHAIEVDWADNWKNAVGQAIVYSQITDRIPGLILICRKSESHCLASSLGVQEALSNYGIEATVWECASEDRILADCIEKAVCPDASC